MTSYEFKRKLLEEFWTPSRSDILLKVGDELIGVDDVYLDDKCNIIIEANSDSNVEENEDGHTD